MIFEEGIWKSRFQVIISRSLRIFKSWSCWNLECFIWFNICLWPKLDFRPFEKQAAAKKFVSSISSFWMLLLLHFIVLWRTKVQMMCLCMGLNPNCSVEQSNGRSSLFYYSRSSWIDGEELELAEYSCGKLRNLFFPNFAIFPQTKKTKKLDTILYNIATFSETLQ